MSDPAAKQLLLGGMPEWEEDDAAIHTVATVVFSEGIDRPLDYLVPERFAGKVTPGMRVAVPLGRRRSGTTGYCVDVASRSKTRPLKPIQSIIDSESLLSHAMLELTKWLADRYVCSWGEAIEAVVPAGVRRHSGTREVAFVSLSEGIDAALTNTRLGPQQKRVVAFLKKIGRPTPASEVAEIVGCTAAPIVALRKKGLLKSEIRRIRRGDVAAVRAPTGSSIELNADQDRSLKAIVDALRQGKHQTFLLFGVTGSGKTEVYMQSISEVVSYGQQAIVLVPEISLTPQTRERFESRFGNVAVLHSHLSDAERHHQWRRIAAGEVQVVVGARSAVFAPTKNLGLIVIDEEHESSFKQESTPRYHARDVALKRAEMAGVPVVLGSATPSLESWHAAQAGRYRLLELPDRVMQLPLPDVLTVDLRDESMPSRGAAISRKLAQAMSGALEDGGQVILLLNRRGYSTHVQCPRCGEVIACPHCEIPLTHHRQGESLICHYCDHEQPSPTHCPECQYAGIRFRGLGTQKLEAEIRARFPRYVCQRIDTDAMKAAGSHERAWEAFRAGKVHILAGTQMIAKGLDFPNVTLVGVINADVGLHLPDFRAGERTFQLITQVAGRSGRGPKGGRVLVQTFTPEHPSIQAATRHSFAELLRTELPVRESLGYPPYAEMARLIFRGPAEEPLREFAGHVSETIREIAAAEGRAQLDVKGPSPAPFAKLRGEWRLHVLLRCRDAVAMRAVIRECQTRCRSPESIRWVADVDPVSML